MNWWWVLFAVAADIVVYCWHGLRWSLLLRPVVKVGVGRTIRAIYVGLFANEVLPFRAGEVLRCYLLTRWTALPFSVSLSSAIIERVFDGLWMFGCLVLTLKLVPLPRQFRYLQDAGYLLGILVITVAAILAIGLFQRRNGERIPTGTGWRRRFAVLVDDLALMGHSSYLLLAFLQSLPYLLLQVIPIWAAFQGYGLDLGIEAAFVLMVIVRLATSIPQAPGNLGLFQLLTEQILERVFQVPAPEAKRFSWVLWGIVTLPLLSAGFVALAITGSRIGELTQAAQKQATDLDAQLS